MGELSYLGSSEGKGAEERKGAAKHCLKINSNN